MWHLRRGLHQVCCVLGTIRTVHSYVDRKRTVISVAETRPVSIGHLIPLHHEVKFFIDFTVFCFCSRSQYVLILVWFGAVRADITIFVFFLAQDLYNVVVRSAFMRFVVFRVFEQDFVHIRTGILEQFVCAIEDYQGDLAIAKNAQFVRFFHQAELPFRKSNLPVTLIRDSRYLDFLTTHGWRSNG